jgi:hypothetical protein
MNDFFGYWRLSSDCDWDETIMGMHPNTNKTANDIKFAISSDSTSLLIAQRFKRDWERIQKAAHA